MLVCNYFGNDHHVIYQFCMERMIYVYDQYSIETIPQKKDKKLKLLYKSNNKYNLDNKYKRFLRKV
jgi:hypothetical protein